MKKTDCIFIAGHNGLVGSSVVKILKNKGYKNILTVISKTTRNDWIQKIHNVDKKIKKQRCHICNMYPSNHKSRNCPDKKPNSP